MKKLVLFLLLSSGIAGFSFSENTDSLFAVWNDSALADSTRAKALTEFIGWKYMYKNVDSAMHYSQVFLDFSRAAKLDLYMGMARSNIGQCYLTLGEMDSAISNFHRGIAHYKQVGYDKGIAGAWSASPRTECHLFQPTTRAISPGPLLRTPEMGLWTIRRYVLGKPVGHGLHGTPFLLGALPWIDRTSRALAFVAFDSLIDRCVGSDAWHTRAFSFTFLTSTSPG